MKNTLMMSAAVIALVAGMGVASAQTDQPKQPSATLEMKNSVSVEQKSKQKAQTKSDAQMKVIVVVNPRTLRIVAVIPA